MARTCTHGASDGPHFHPFQHFFLLCSLKPHTPDFFQPLQPFLFHTPTPRAHVLSLSPLSLLHWHTHTHTHTHTLLVFVSLVSSLIASSLNRPVLGEGGIRGLDECAAVVVQQTGVQRVLLSDGARARVWVNGWALEFRFFSPLSQGGVALTYIAVICTWPALLGNHQRWLVILCVCEKCFQPTWSSSQLKLLLPLSVFSSISISLSLCRTFSFTKDYQSLFDSRKPCYTCKYWLSRAAAHLDFGWYRTFDDISLFVVVSSFYSCTHSCVCVCVYKKEKRRAVVNEYSTSN